MKVLLFARIREQVGLEQLEVPGCADIAALRQWMQSRFPQQQSLFATDFALVAVNQEIEPDDACVLKDSDEVAFLPPMTGG